MTSKNNNDIKYVMLPRIEDKPKNIKPRPWYVDISKFTFDF